MNHSKLIGRFLIALAIPMLISSCTPKDRVTTVNSKINPKVKAPPIVEDSFQVLNSGSDSKEVVIKINKKVLGKAFLISPSVIDYYLAPRVYHLKPKVVWFKQKAEQLAMYELDTTSVYDDIASDKLIQTFEIKSDADSFLEFNLKFGFSSVEMADGLSAIEDTAGAPQQQAIATPTSSYLESAKFVNNELLITQNSKIKSDFLNLNFLYVLAGLPIPLQTAESNLKIQTRISPYTQNLNFVPKPTYPSDIKKVGYFATNKTQKNSGKVEHFANRWDISENSGPITYVITKNTPDEFVQPIKEGILYWNQYLGKEVFKVETGGDPQEIGSYRRSIVHWAPWKTAGFSVASLQADPISGEILTTNVYLTSAFPEGMKLSTLLELKKTEQAYKTESAKSVPTTTRILTPNGFAFDISCTLRMDKLVDGILTHLEAFKASPGALLKAQKDIVRLVAAHEVGHTVGLRHNFSGSAASEFETWKDLQDEFTQYLTEESEDHVGHTASSSVMDYLPYKDSLLTGAKVKSGSLAYDSNAIAWGYKNDTIASEKSVPFCSDGEASTKTAIDCSLFDSGRDPLMSSILEYNAVNKTAMGNIYQLIMEMKFGQAGNDPNLTFNEIFEQRLIIKDSLSASTQLFESIQKAMTTNARYIGLNRQIGAPTDTNHKQYLEALTQKQTQQFAALGGLTGLISKLIPTSETFSVKTGWLKSQVDAIVNSPTYGTGTTITGNSFTLSETEKSELKSALLSYATQMEVATLDSALDKLAPSITYNAALSLNLGVLSALGGATTDSLPYNPKLPIDSWSADLGTFVSNIFTDNNDSLSITEGSVAFNLVLPKHAYTTRIAAIRLLSGNLVRRDNWMLDTKAKLFIGQREKLTSNLNLVAAQTTSDKIATADIYIKIKSIQSEQVKTWSLREFAVYRNLEEILTTDLTATTPTSEELKKYLSAEDTNDKVGL